MSLQDIEKKVLASAEGEAREIIEKAEAEAKAELDRKSASLRDEQQRKIGVGKAEADSAAERDLTTRRAEHGMKVLQRKNEVLDAIFGQARQRILSSQGFDYGRWLATQVRRAVGAGAGVLHCNARDRVTVEAVVRETGTTRVTVSPENGPMLGGVLLVGESVDLDLTLDSALADLRGELTIALAERLFADVPPIGKAAAGG